MNSYKIRLLSAYFFRTIICVILFGYKTFSFGADVSLTKDTKIRKIGVSGMPVYLSDWVKLSHRVKSSPQLLTEHPTATSRVSVNIKSFYNSEEIAISQKKEAKLYLALNLNNTGAYEVYETDFKVQNGGLRSESVPLGSYCIILTRNLANEKITVLISERNENGDIDLFIETFIDDSDFEFIIENTCAEGAGSPGVTSIFPDARPFRTVIVPATNK